MGHPIKRILTIKPRYYYLFLFGMVHAFLYEEQGPIQQYCPDRDNGGYGWNKEMHTREE
jgi:hypothetical protein